MLRYHNKFEIIDQMMRKCIIKCDGKCCEFRNKIRSDKVRYPFSTFIKDKLETRKNCNINMWGLSHTILFFILTLIFPVTFIFIGVYMGIFRIYFWFTRLVRYTIKFNWYTIGKNYNWLI